jgi:NitT/TauT family transport system substrate-binding protein
MGINPWIGYAPWYIAQEKGYFKENGLNVDFVSFQTDADRNAAIVAGKTDVSNVDTGGVVRFTAKNQPVVPIFLEDASTGADAILSTPDITTAQQLVGKEVAYEFGTTSDLLLHYYLNKNGIKADQVISKNAPAADAGTLLIAGKVPAAVTYEPYISAATSAHKDKAHVLFSSADAPGLISDWLTANKGWLDTHKRETLALVKSWNQAVEFFNNNKEEGTAIMAKGVGSKPEDLTSTLAGVKFYTIGENVKLMASGELAQQVKDVSKTMMSQTPPGVDQEVNIADLIKANLSAYLGG